MPHSQGLSNNPEPNQLVLKPICLRSIRILSSHLHLGLPINLSTAGVPVEILKELLSSSFWLLITEV
jgi:hypothetical protein